MMNAKKTAATISGVLIGGAILSYCLAQSQHPKPHAGSVTARIRPYDPARQARDQKYEQLVEKGAKALQDDPEEAEACFRKATVLDPSETEAWMGLARSLDAQGQDTQSLAAYAQVFDSPSGSGEYSNFPSDVESLARYGTLSEAAGQHQAALRAYARASAQLNPPPRVPLNTLSQTMPGSKSQLRALLEVVQGIALTYQNKSGKALELFEEAARNQPNDARVQYYLGYGLQKAGQPKAAQAAYQKAAQLDTEGTVKAAAVKSLQTVGGTR